MNQSNGFHKPGEKHYAGETPNRPHPMNIELWGKNTFIGKVIPNEEYRTAGGIIMADTKTVQFAPQACDVVNISCDIDSDKYPGISLGKRVFYYALAGERLTWDDEDYILLDARSVIGSFDPVGQVSE